MNEVHKCVKFHRTRREGPWQQAGFLREREIEAVSICKDCGRERPGRFRKVIAVEKEGTQPEHGAADASLRRLSRRIASLSQSRTELRANGLIRRLGGIQAESEIERLASSAPLRLVYRPSSGTLQLHSIRVLDRPSLEEIAWPGVLARRARVLAEARNSVRDFVNPEAVTIRELLAAHEALALDEKVIKALAALACLLETGDVLPARAFSAQVLGNSKSLSMIRKRLERLVGPLERLGIRDWGGLVLMGGAGVLHLQSTDIRLDSLRCIGVSSDDILRMRNLELPPSGVLIVENLTPFQACLGHLDRSSSVLLLWSGGFPNRGVKRLLEEAARGRARIRVWCDLDLGGIRIARLIHDITSGTAEPVLMSPVTVQESKVSCRLSAENMARIRHDLEQHPDGILADTLRAILNREEWIEQETLLSKMKFVLQN